MVHVHNRHGTPVDPVPFLVVTGFAVLLTFSSGPIYLMEYGLALLEALAGSALVCLATIGWAYHRYVWTARPEFRGEVPAMVRIRRLFYGMAIVGGIFLLLSLPIVLGGA